MADIIPHLFAGAMLVGAVGFLFFVCLGVAVVFAAARHLGGDA